MELIEETNLDEQEIEELESLGVYFDDTGDCWTRNEINALRVEQRTREYLRQRYG